MPHTILVIEDERTLADTIQLNLELEGYQVICAYDGITAEELIKQKHASIQLVLLDIMLPGKNGFDIFNVIKNTNSQLPVIFMTARSDSTDKIKGLKLGAEDYITKPFDLEELLLRIHNVLKHIAPNTKSIFSFGNHNHINFNTYEIKGVHQIALSLSKREILLLKLLIEKKEQVVSRDEILDKLWSSDENPSSRTIDNYILSFRKYFEEDSKTPKHFHSIRGVGYKFTP